MQVRNRSGSESSIRQSLSVRYTDWSSSSHSCQDGVNAVMLACCGSDDVDMLQLLVGVYHMDPNAKDFVRVHTV